MWELRHRSNLQPEKVGPFEKWTEASLSVYGPWPWSLEVCAAGRQTHMNRGAP